MSQRTIIELNHDYCRDLPETMRRLIEALPSASQKELTALARETNGVRVIAQRHHSDKVDIKINGYDVIW